MRLTPEVAIKYPRVREVAIDSSWSSAPRSKDSENFPFEVFQVSYRTHHAAGHVNTARFVANVFRVEGNKVPPTLTVSDGR